MATTESAAGVASTGGHIDALLQEDRRYPPTDEFKAQANWNDPSIYQRAEADPEAFWAEQAQAIDCFTPGTRSWSGTRPGPSGSSAPRSTPATTASIGTSRPGAAIKPRSSSKVNRA